MLKIYLEELLATAPEDGHDYYVLALPAYKCFYHQSHRRGRRQHDSALDIEIENNVSDTDTTYNELAGVV